MKKIKTGKPKTSLSEKNKKKKNISSPQTTTNGKKGKVKEKKRERKNLFIKKEIKEKKFFWPYGNCPIL